MTTCPHCTSQLIGNFCGHCGKPAKLERIDSLYILHEVQHLLHFEKGFLYTVKELLLRPGKTVRTFLYEDRDKYAKPIVFAIFAALIFSVIMRLTNVNYSLFSISEGETHSNLFRTTEINDWTQNHIGYVTLVMSIFTALMINLFFRKHNINLIEIIILMCYVSGEAILLLGIIVFIAKIIESGLIGVVAMLIYLVYPVWAIGQFFGEKKPINYLKAVLAYFVGVCLYTLTLLLIAYCYRQLS